MDNCIIILVCTLLAMLLVYTISKKEGFGFPFNTLSRTPQPPNVIFSMPAPYCTNDLGQPIPCPIPCQKVCETCQYDYPVLAAQSAAPSPTSHQLVPVFGIEEGAYSPSKWCPGPPLC